MYPPGARHTAACVRHTTSTFKNARHRAPIHLIALAPNATLHLPSAHTHTSQALAPFRVRKGRKKAVPAHASDVTGPDPRPQTAGSIETQKVQVDNHHLCGDDDND
ncbi:hypothetical protein AcW1_010028 [Taiwanofungus camphoratus]|nr:hypothetical protein AcW1_010028 [Antrodia cinnamomea]